MKCFFLCVIGLSMSYYAAKTEEYLVNKPLQAAGMSADNARD